jgi:hypothetical protein
MGASGTIELDFGAFPGATYTTVAVTGQAAIVAGSLAEAWIRPIATTDHSIDDHIIDPPRVIVANIVAGTGFTIHGFATENHTHLNLSIAGSRNINIPLHWGKYTVAWVWN